MIKVVIAITTYNLKDYISKALDSVLMQKTNFEYKIIVADDCSTDGTLQILYKYKKQYPGKIEVLVSEKNLGSLANSNRIFDKLECEYFSFLDGDDYWIDEKHLQKQVDFLDQHLEYMLCGGNTQYLRNNVLAEYVVPVEKCNKTYTFESMLKDTIPFVHTSALLIRNTIFKNGLPECYRRVVNTFENCALRGEDFRRILHLEKGAMYIFSDVVSVYRIHEKGMWQGSSQTKRAIESAIGFNFYKKYFGNKYGDYFEKRAKASYQGMMRTLVIDRNLLGDFMLNEKEAYLLTSLLDDISNENTLCYQHSKVMRILLNIIIRIFFVK